MGKKLYKVRHRVIISKDFYVWADDEDQAWDLVDNGYIHDLNEYEYVASQLGDVDRVPPSDEWEIHDLDTLNPEDKPQEDEE